MIQTNSYGKFLSSLDEVSKKIIGNKVKNLDRGCLGNSKLIRTCNDGAANRRLYELVIDYKQGYRVYWCKNKKEVWCLNAGYKKSQKQDIEVAKKIINKAFA